MMTQALLKKFVDGKCSAAEHDRVSRWLLDNDNEKQADAFFKMIWQVSSDAMPPELQDKKEEMIRGVLEHQATRRPVAISSPRYPKVNALSKWSWAKIAASVTLLIGICWMAYRYASSPKVNDQPTVFVEKNAPKGKKLTVSLPDGSVVRLNSGSQIRYPKSWTGGVREVNLVGEAFFDVKKDPDRPFVVHTAHLSTTVLGTSFNVKAFADTPTEVALVTGKVEVKATDSITSDEKTEALYLTPNQMATYQRSSNKIHVSSFNLAEITGWKDGVLVFNNSDIRVIMEKLERWYGVEVKIEGGQTDWRYTGKFDNKTLSYVLKAIAYTSGMTFSLEKDQVILKPT